MEPDPRRRGRYVLPRGKGKRDKTLVRLGRDRGREREKKWDRVESRVHRPKRVNPEMVSQIQREINNSIPSGCTNGGNMLIQATARGRVCVEAAQRRGEEKERKKKVHEIKKHLMLAPRGNKSYQRRRENGHSQGREHKRAHQ